VKQKSPGLCPILWTGTCYLGKLKSAFSIVSDITWVLIWTINFSSKEKRSLYNFILEKEKSGLDVRSKALPLKENYALFSFYLQAPHTNRPTFNEASKCLPNFDILLRLCQDGLSLIIKRHHGSFDIFSGARI